MFNDREKALQELEQQLLEEEEECEEAQDEEWDEEEEEESVRTPRVPFDFDAYNTDVSDTDLEDYSEEVYSCKRKTGCSVWLLLLAALILAIAYFLAKREGLL